jgi:hypothetical protein
VGSSRQPSEPRSGVVSVGRQPLRHQHRMDAFIWANFPLKPRPERLVG